jgi:hypothetical protein
MSDLNKNARRAAEAILIILQEDARRSSLEITIIPDTNEISVNETVLINRKFSKAQIEAILYRYFEKLPEHRSMTMVVSQHGHVILEVV